MGILLHHNNFCVILSYISANKWTKNIDKE